MIKVLQNWQEVGQATLSIQRQGLPRHYDPQKNWDHFLLYQIIGSKSRDASIFDLGCGGFYTLNFLSSVGFTNLQGIDLDLDIDVEGNTPYRLYQGDLTKTPLADSAFDIVYSVSVIEHGVDLEAFFQEAARLLKPGGLLFLTTDYWEAEIAINSEIKPFGLSWKVFSKQDIQELINLAKKHGFILEQDGDIPPCQETTVFWQNTDYTFIALLFTKVG